MGQKLISMSAAARLWGVAPKTVREWWLKGYLVRASDGRVDVERSEARLKRRPHRYRGGVCRGPVAPVQTRAERLLAHAGFVSGIPRRRAHRRTGGQRCPLPVNARSFAPRRARERVRSTLPSV